MLTSFDMFAQCEELEESWFFNRDGFLDEDSDCYIDLTILREVF